MAGGAIDSLRRKGWALAASVVIALSFAWVLHAGALPVIPPASAFSEASWWAVAGYGVIWLALQLLRAARWQLLLAPLGEVSLGRVMRICLIGYALLLLLPFRMGEVARPAMIRKSAGLSMMAATGTIGAERIIDGLFLSLMLIGALLVSTPVSPLPDHIGELPVPAAIVPGAALVAVTAFLVLTLAMTAFYFFRATARRATLRILGVLSATLAERTAGAIERLATGLSFLAQWRASVPFVAVTAIYWFGYGIGAWLLLAAFGLGGLSFSEVLVICGVLAVGVIVPSAPGFFGSFQISVYAGMVMFLPLHLVVGPGSAFVFVLYAIQVGSTLLLGLGAAVWERRVVRRTGQ